MGCGASMNKVHAANEPPTALPPLEKERRGSNQTPRKSDSSVVFRVPLKDLAKDGRLIPAFVQAVVSKLRASLDVEGLFRAPGSQLMIYKIKSDLDTGLVSDIPEYFSKQDVHTLTGLLKVFLRELPSPLITYETYEKLLPILNECKQTTPLLPPQAPAGSSASTQTQQPPQQMYQVTSAHVERIVNILEGMPREHLALMHCLLDLSVLVGSRWKVNSMTPKNISLILAPCIFRQNQITSRDPELALIDLGEVGRFSELLLLMLENWSLISSKLSTHQVLQQLQQQHQQQQHQQHQQPQQQPQAVTQPS